MSKEDKGATLEVFKNTLFNLFHWILRNPLSNIFVCKSIFQWSPQTVFVCTVFLFVNRKGAWLVLWHCQLEILDHPTDKYNFWYLTSLSFRQEFDLVPIMKLLMGLFPMQKIAFYSSLSLFKCNSKQILRTVSFPTEI